MVARSMLSHISLALVAILVTISAMALLAGTGLIAVTPGQGHTRNEVVARLAVVWVLTSAVLVACGALAGYLCASPLRTLRRVAARLRAGRYDEPLPAPCLGVRGIFADLDRLRVTLAEAESRRVRLLGEVAHEMRTPLAVIDGYVEGMIDGIIPRTPDELVRLIDETRRLRRLADDLSALSHGEEGRIHLVPTRLDLRTVVTSASERLRPQLVDAGLTLVVNAGVEPLPVCIDPDRVSQVVRNLLGNAIRATPPGGSVTVTAGLSGHWAWFSVRDTGEGIGSADLERIFERFYRAPGRRQSHRETGSGIGLTIALQLMRAHGGELVARSGGRGTGAEFVGWLPSAS